MSKFESALVKTHHPGRRKRQWLMKALPLPSSKRLQQHRQEMMLFAKLISMLDCLQLQLLLRGLRQTRPRLSNPVPRPEEVRDTERFTKSISRKEPKKRTVLDPEEICRWWMKVKKISLPLCRAPQ